MATRWADNMVTDWNLQSTKSFIDEWLVSPFKRIYLTVETHCKTHRTHPRELPGLKKSAGQCWELSRMTQVFSSFPYMMKASKGGKMEGIFSLRSFCCQSEVSGEVQLQDYNRQIRCTDFTRNLKSKRNSSQNNKTSLLGQARKKLSKRRLWHNWWEGWLDLDTLVISALGAARQVWLYFERQKS